MNEEVKKQLTGEENISIPIQYMNLYKIYFNNKEDLVKSKQYKKIRFSEEINTL